MNVRDFEYISSIARNRSISKAAEELFISQPALSKFLKRLEKEAGTKLFQHNGKTLVPTLAGEFCIEKAMEVLHLNEQINCRITDIAKLKSGRIRIGLPLSRTDHFLSRVLPEFYKKYPNFQIIIKEDAAGTLMQKIRNGELDMIFVNFTDQQPFLHYEIVPEEEMVLAVPARHQLQHYAYSIDGYQFPCLEPNKWAHLPFIILSRDQATRNFTNHYFEQHQIAPPIALEIRNLAQAINAVHYGIGVTITPAIFSDKTTDIDYFSLPSKEGPTLRKAAVIYRKDTYLSQAECDFIKIILQSFQTKNP